MAAAALIKGPSQNDFVPHSASAEAFPGVISVDSHLEEQGDIVSASFRRSAV